MKKYLVSYTSGSTGYGWDKECDTIEEVENTLDGLTHEYTAALRVWDNDIQDFIYWKDVLTYEPTINILGDGMRDLRTTTRYRKIAVK